MQPVLVLVSGPPCSGKTTLARRVCSRYGWAGLEKDLVKEALFDTLGTSDRPWSRKLSDASFAVLFAFARRAAASRLSAVIEGNFRAEHAPLLQQLQSELAVRFVQISCGGSGDVLLERYQGRVRRNARHPGHVDALALEELRPQLLQGFAPALPLPGLQLRFDSTIPDSQRQLEDLFRHLDNPSG